MNVKQEFDLSLEQSAIVEEVLDTWYRWQEHQSNSELRRLWFRPEDHTCRGYSSPNDSEGMADEADAWVDASIGEQVQLCVDDLCVEHRAALSTGMRNKQSGASVWRSVRVLEEQHVVYQAAKVALWPMFLSRSIVRRIPVAA